MRVHERWLVLQSLLVKRVSAFMYLLLCVCVAVVSAQMCQNYGRECFDHSDCCGGCCTNSVCVESTRLCNAPVEDCMMFYCPPGFSCSLYQAPGCPGCAIVRYCRPYQPHDLRPFWLRKLTGHSK